MSSYYLSLHQDTYTTVLLPASPNPSSVEFKSINMAQFISISNEQFVPAKLRRGMKNTIHSSHLGAESCLRRARECLFWPGMSAEIRQLVAQCTTCARFCTSQQKETLMPHELPSRPWQKVGVDLFENNNNYMITVDYFSNYWEVELLNSSTTPRSMAPCHQLDILPDVSLSKIYVRDFQELASAFVRLLASDLLAWHEFFLAKKKQRIISVKFVIKIKINW